MTKKKDENETAFDALRKIKGGLKSSKARLEKLTPSKRREIAEKAAKTRWSKK